MAILPAPVWATVPTSTPFTVTSGAATWSAAGTTGTINITADRSILTWGNTAQLDSTTITNFNIASGETFNFVQPAGGAVLNKVSAGTNTTSTIFNGFTGGAAAVINGSLISNGRVIILSTSGNIIVGGGAQITTSGTVLSTLAESSDFNFTAQGNLALSNTSASNGSIFLGTGASAVNAVGNLAAYAGAVTTNNLSVTGDLILNQNGLSALALTTANPTTVTGNFSATTNNTAITKGSGLLTVSGNATLKSGTGDILLPGTVGSVSLTNSGGTGYTAVPAVTLSGGGSITTPTLAASGGAAAALLGVNTAPVTAGGTGYTAATVSVAFSAPAAGGTTATGTAVVNTSGVITGINITSAGSGYTSVPTFTITDSGTGTGATPGTVALRVVGLNGVVGGTNYLTNPTVAIAAPGSGTTATAAALIQGSSFGGTLSTNSTGNVVIAATGNLALGASTAGNLVLSAAGDIATSAAVAVNATANLISRTSGNITFANGSTAAALTASTGAGNVTVNTTSNLTVGNITAGGASDVTITANNTTLDGTILAGNNVTITGNSLSSTTNGIIGTSAAFTRSVSVNATGANANVVLPGISTRTLSVQTAGGSVSQFGTGAINPIVVTGNSGASGVAGAVTINAGTTGSITLNANNSFNGTSSTLNLTGNNVNIAASSGVTFGSLNAAGSVTVNTASSAFGSGAVTFGVGGGTSASNITIGGSLAVSTNGSNVGDDPQANETIFGSVSINTIAAGFGQLANNVTVSGGSGFLRSPTVVITGNVAGGSNATATATFNSTTSTVTALNVSNGGGGFSGAPSIAFVGGGTPTSAATTGAVATFGTTGNLSVGAIPVTGAGTGYTAAPVVNITAAPSGGTNATATAVVDTNTGTVVSIAVTNPGSGYTAAPTITLVGGGGNTATLTTGGMVAPTSVVSVIPKGDVNFSAQVNQGSGTYGQWTVNAGGVTIAERTTLNVATINGTSISLRSTAGDILINGQQNAYNAGDVSLRANAGSLTQVSGAINAPGSTLTANINGSSGNVTLNNTSNVFGTLSYNASSANTTANIIAASSVLVDRPAAGTTNLSVSTLGTGSNITVSAGGYNGTATFNSAGTITLTSNNSTNSLSARNLILIAGDTGASSIGQNSSGSYTGLNVNGTLTLTTPGGVTLTSANNPSLGNVVLTNVTSSTSVVALNTTGNISNVSGVAAGTVNLTSGTVGQNSVPVASTITLGNLTAGNLNARAQNGGNSGEGTNSLANGASGDIKQATNSSLHVENTLTAVTFNGGNIVLGNAGNSAGRVQLSTAGALPAAGVFTQTTTGSSGNISYTEDSTAKLGALQTAGSATINSRFAGIIEDPAANDTFYVGGVLTLNAPAGSISLGNNTHTAGVTTSNVAAMNATAAGSASLFANGDLVLGSIAANSLTVQANSIAQSAPLNIFGLSSFIAMNATTPTTSGGITLTNPANNFGPISINVTGPNQSVALTENSTLNLRSVTTVTPSNGTFTATSVNGDIIDTGLGGVRLGGSIVGGVSTSGSGVVTLTATNGNIVINDPTTDILTSAGVVFNANNVTLSVFGSPGSTLVLGANSASSVAKGTLVATSGLGNIGNNGAISVGGLATIQTGNGNIAIDKPNVGFGTLLFSGNQVIIRESGNMDIVTGSSAFGQAQLASGGDITIVPGAGSVTFGNSVAMQATGNITLRQMQAVGTLLLSHTGTANLSALSNSTDLNGRWTNDNDLGTGPGPKTDATLAPKP